MELYHGSYCEVKNPNIRYSRDSLDFGKGFYLTDIKDQALNWSKRFIKRSKTGYLNIYALDFDNLEKLYNIKVFDSYDMEWLDFILDCRNQGKKYLEYDVIIGGIADDRVYNTIELYQTELISKDEALKRLKYYKPNNQICIVNQEILDKHLNFIKCEVQIMEANKILLQKMYTKIIMEFSKQTGKTLEESIDYFYKSETYDLIKNGVSDMHCRGYRYLADELMLEYGFKHHEGYCN